MQSGLRVVATQQREREREREKKKKTKRKRRKSGSGPYNEQSIVYWPIHSSS